MTDEENRFRVFFGCQISKAVSLININLSFKFGFVEELVAPLSLIFVGHPERAAGESKDLGRRPLDGGRF